MVRLKWINKYEALWGDMKDVIQKEETEMAEKTGIEAPIPQNEMESYMKKVMEEVALARKKKIS